MSVGYAIGFALGVGLFFVIQIAVMSLEDQLRGPRWRFNAPRRANPVRWRRLLGIEPPQCEFQDAFWQSRCNKPAGHIGPHRDNHMGWKLPHPPPARYAETSSRGGG